MRPSILVGRPGLRDPGVQANHEKEELSCKQVELCKERTRYLHEVG
jgi:hypothetical protein